MSGHSKWSNIKNKKGKADAQRGAIFTKLGREIAIAVRNGGPDPAGNSRLKDVIAKAKAANMPNDNINRSIQKASGSVEADNFEEIRYEGYGAAGVAVIVNVLTDNRNRTAGDVRHIFDKFGGNLGTTGCVSFMFEEKGTIIVSREDFPDEDQVILDSLEAGAEDVSGEDEVYEIVTASADYYDVKDALEAKGYTFLDASIGMVPNTWTTVSDEETQAKLDRMIELLEDHEDIKEVFHNYDSGKDDET
ncbi:MAG: YebC/PmpR family DNA-binding transcriptional regulator [Saccharofermentanales bacterium]